MGKNKDIVVEARRDVLSAYHLWLNQKVYNDISSSYTQVLGMLWRTDFIAEYENDENRIGDAMVLRDEFAEEAKLENSEYLKLKSASIRLIEVMIRLSQKVSEIISTEDRMSLYFWEMVASMEINKFDDGNFNASSVQKHIDILLGHKYRRNGRGGLFFIKGMDPSYNAPGLDLWTQAMAYINAKRGVDV